MPAKGFRKYTPAQLKKLREAYATMPLREAAALVGMDYGKAYWQIWSNGWVRKPLSASIRMKPVVMTEPDLHYFAGLIDGEGTVTVRKQQKGPNRPPGLKPWVCVSNTDRRMMDWILERVPGPDVRLDSRRHGGGEYHRVIIQGLGHLPLYRRLQPLLVIKGDLMAVVIEWCEIRLSQSKSDPLTKEQLDIVSRIRERNMSPLKRLAAGTYGTYLSTTSQREVASTK